MNETERIVFNGKNIMNKLSQDPNDETKRYFLFRQIFNDYYSPVRLLTNALNFIGYFYPESSPEYDPDYIARNPDLRDSINYPYGDETIDLAEYLYSHFILAQNNVIIYKCYVLNNGQWIEKFLPLTNKVFSELHLLLSELEIIYNLNENEQIFWNDYKFSELINSIELIKQRNTPVALQLQDYKSILIKINLTDQIYVIKDQQVKAVFDKFSALERTILPADQSYHDPIFAHMSINTGKDKLKANIDNAIKHLFFFTIGDKNTFDNLAKDLISLATHPGFKQRNTIVKGDLDKLDKWLNLINSISPYILPIGKGFCVIPLDYSVQRELIMEHIPLINEVCQHVYCMCSQNIQYSDPGNKHIHLNFPYGGRFYELPKLTANELIWITELLFAHGWHLINGTQTSRKAKTRNVEDEFTRFLKKCDEINEIRIPAALVYQLYTAYARKEKQAKEVSDSELYKIIKDKGIEYGTFKSRDADISYISSELKPIMEKTGIAFEDKWTEKNKGHKSFKCTISNELWKTLTAPSPEAENSADEEKFSKYIKELFSRYEYLFKYETIESPIKNDMDYVEGNFRPIGSIYIK